MAYGVGIRQSEMTTTEFVKKITDSANSYPDAVFSTPGKVYTCVNPYSYHMVRKNAELYSRLDGLFVDGFTMCMWIRLLWGCKIPRLSFDMSSMAADLFDALNGDMRDRSIYFLGTRQEAIEKTIDRIRSSYPSMNIKGFRNGYFKDDNERNEAIARIVELNPDFVIIGMGSPIQERFVLDLKKGGYKGIAFTCGGFLHQTSERINYYPTWVNKLNLRAFYRLYKEKGMAGRLWQVLVGFPAYFIYDSFKNR